MTDVDALRARAYGLIDLMEQASADDAVPTKAAAHLVIDTITTALGLLDQIAGSLYALAQDRST